MQGANIERGRHIGDAVTVITDAGRRSIALRDMFTGGVEHGGEIGLFPHIRETGRVEWCQGGWIDEKRRRLVVVTRAVGEFGGHVEGTIALYRRRARIRGEKWTPVPDISVGGRLVRIVHLVNGEVAGGQMSNVLKLAITERHSGSLRLALDLAIEQELPLPKLALYALVEDPELSLAIRLRAVVVLGHWPAPQILIHVL